MVKQHTDNGAYFRTTVRLHMPVVSTPRARMFCDGCFYHMKPGEVWALNNIGLRAVLNDHPTDARTHLICDFRPAPELRELISNGQGELGFEDPASLARLQSNRPGP